MSEEYWLQFTREELTVLLQALHSQEQHWNGAAESYDSVLHYSLHGRLTSTISEQPRIPPLSLALSQGLFQCMIHHSLAVLFFRSCTHLFASNT